MRSIVRPGKPEFLGCMTVAAQEDTVRVIRISRSTTISKYHIQAGINGIGRCSGLHAHALSLRC